LRSAFPDPWLRHYSLKANDVIAIVRLLAERGLDANVVSRGEWAIARAAGVPNHRTTLEGVGKTPRDLRAAVDAAVRRDPLRWVSIESVDEAEDLAGLTARMRPARPVDVLFRLNPAVTPETHRGLAVGAGHSKFGLTESEISEALARVLRAGGAIVPRGIHVHVGSQLGAIDAWRDAVRRSLAVLGLLRGSVPTLDTLDVGGGFPVAPIAEPAPDPTRFAAELPSLLAAIPTDRRPDRLAIEPGRFLVARSGYLVARVLHARDRDGPQVILDAGMTELIRPALYGARHPVVALTVAGRPAPVDVTAIPTRVEGPICESTDSLGVHDLPDLRRGDLVAIRDAGAYAASFASTYNGRPRPPQVVLELTGRPALVRPRGRLPG
jgi:diaminopimelate decarboxylase